MTINTRSNTGLQSTTTADEFGSLIKTDSSNNIWVDVTYITSTWTDYSNEAYIALADSTGTAWYFWTDGFGSFIISETAPSEHLIDSDDTGTSGNYIYLLIEEDATTWYVYPDGFGSLTVSETEPT